MIRWSFPVLIVGAAGVALFGLSRGSHAQDPNLSVVDTFDANAEGWQVYDYNGGISGGGNVFYPATWESSGGVGNSGYVWGDDSRWRIDTPEDPHSILSFIVYRRWIGGGTLDLRDARMSVSLRGDALDLKGGSVYFWVLGHGGGTTRWHLTTSPLDVADGEWDSLQSVILANDESLWHRSWAWENNPASLDQVLRSADSYGFSFVGFSEEVTGRFSMDQLSLVAVPEPTGLLLWSTGAAFLYLVRKRNRRSATRHSAVMEMHP